eukprot:CAMPEP_0202470676 /NCGR_PEP_ID=MMETSP1360-20130828/82305_1 /ASSEMBLY_ACC=CAM_ASM_000848 /TAXON_ID=515479 /ORGANISM="Licmophora paradoxa, Strain CCMP2313" /LENGTH=185 /DNA_ID=CAMNT_0049096453 /DNA_START=458 /DNA_END=1015 /DNA_ORIENTATION=+
MSYADLAPESESTLPGQLFLATNIAYTAGGFLLQQHGELLLGGLTEIASVASFGYHYGQLATSRVNKETVQLYLLVDYAVAFVTLGTAFVYLVQAAKAGEPDTLTAAVASISSYIPIDGLVASFLAVVFLLLSWVWEKGIPYMINHGLWHLLGAYGGYTIGQAHLDQLAAAAVTTAPVTTTMLSI